MRSLLRLLKLSPGEAATLCRVSLLLILAEAGLRILSFPAILRAIGAHLGGVEPRMTPDALLRLARLVEIADSRGPFRPSCLRQALVTAWLLRGRGVAATVRIGVAREQGRVRAHAWVEVPDRPPIRLFDDPDFADLGCLPAAPKIPLWRALG
jgi:hypothetical protein